MCTSELGDEKASSLEINYDTNQRWGKMKRRNWLALSAEWARAGAAEHVKNAAEWWGSPAVWRLILMDPVLLSKVPLAPVSDWALWVTSAMTETVTHPLHCWYSTTKVCNLKMWLCNAMISLLHTTSPEQKFLNQKNDMNVCHRIFSLHGLEPWKFEF